MNDRVSIKKISFGHTNCYLVKTHGHADHVGNAEALRAGDAAMNFMGKTIPSIFGEDEETMRTALKKIIKYKKENIHNGAH